MSESTTFTEDHLWSVLNEHADEPIHTDKKPGIKLVLDNRVKDNGVQAAEKYLQHFLGVPKSIGATLGGNYIQFVYKGEEVDDGEA